MDRQRYGDRDRASDCFRWCSRCGCAGRTEGLLAGERADIVVGPAWSALEPLLETAGLAVDGEVTELGCANLLARVPAPSESSPPTTRTSVSWRSCSDPVARSSGVRRAENVAASQDANRKSFRTANAALDRFCDEHDFGYSVFIEHAVGQGEAVRQRFRARWGEFDSLLRRRPGGRRDRSGGAPTARLGVLPRNMEFVRRADIGEPAKVHRPFEIEGRGRSTEP